MNKKKLKENMSECEDGDKSEGTTTAAQRLRNIASSFGYRGRYFTVHNSRNSNGYNNMLWYALKYIKYKMNYKETTDRRAERERERVSV